MAEPQFWRRAAPLTIVEIVSLTGAKPREGDDLSAVIANVAPLDEAGPGDLAFLDNPKYAGLLETSRASAIFAAARYADRIPRGCAALIAPEPYRAYAQVAARLYPDAMRPQSRSGESAISPAAHVHPEAQLENGVIVDAGAVIGPRAQIGAGTLIAANAVIGPDVCIGRECAISSGAQISFALIGDRVIIHPGVCIGQDGFGFAMGPRGHLKVPQLGRVIIQNDVEIGANSAIDRGTNRDTVIGEGTKIDNFVQIGHNVTIGRHCIIVSHVGISGSTDLGDFVAVGGQVGMAGHLKIGSGVQIAAQSGVVNDIPPGERWGGTPARPMRQMARQIAMLDRMVKKPD
ncbi:MAG: UDP-3-O-(3-hydroxymyristoyl)glucosamine N-acyltransferase [Alphaproteobacteria bacterium]|nr:UDP-3-O-(3-hydroxymyristoyl)glucosamine N-acyltransferase [Alphaproteobacteria bacterium]